MSFFLRRHLGFTRCSIITITVSCFSLCISGDYIYEYGIDEFPDPKTTVRPASSLQPQHVLVTLDDYRQRYALYHTDPDLQALHQAAPLLAAWDDHEFANNAWVNGSQEQNSTIDGPWHVRVRNAVQAYHEWLPTRYFLDDGNYLKYWRSVQFGNLATLMLLETRVTARTDPNVIPDVFSSAGAMGFSVLPPSQWSSQPAMIAKIKELKASTDAYRNLPNLTVIGQGEQLQWLNDTVIQSVKTGTRWQLLAQDTVMLESLAPDLEGAIAQEKDAAKAAFWKERYFNLTSGANATTTLNTTAGSFVPLNGVPIPVTDAMRYAVRAAQALGQYRINYDFDSWAGYQYNKRQILQAMASSRNAIIYGGDSHNAWGGIESLDGKPFAAEFDGPAVTSIGFEGYFPFVPTDLVAAGMLVSNGEFGMKYAETNHKGYMLVTLNHSNHHTEYVMVDNIISRNYQAYCDYAVDSIDGQVGTWVQSSTCLGA